jgi:hypothetical protein
VVFVTASEPVSRSEVSLLPQGTFNDFVELTVKLSGAIETPGWRICYEGWRGVGSLTGPVELMVRPPTVDAGGIIQLFCRESKVESYVKYIDERVRMANERFNMPEIPQDPEEAAKRAAEQAEDFIRRCAELDEIVSRIPAP